MKTEVPSVHPVVGAFACAVCGAQLDLQHVERGNQGALCTFCGARQPAELISEHPNGADSGAGSVQRQAPMDVGDALREARRARGESLEQASRATRVRESYLQALEEDEQSFDPYPGRVYARFFLREYAEYLGLNAEPLLRRFDHDALPALAALPPTSLFRRAPRPKRWAVAALVVLVAMLASAAAFNRFGPEPAASSSAGPRHHLASSAPPKQETGHSATPPRITRIDAVITIVGLGRSWIKVTADGTTVFEQTRSGPLTLRFHANRTLELTLGSGGAVQLEVGGKTIPTGAVGEVQDFAWTIRNGRLIRS
jgi:transcriptional regulator with XRE-family HTH domain